MFWFYGCEAYGILVPCPGFEPTPPALEGEVNHHQHRGPRFRFQLNQFYLSANILKPKLELEILLRCMG